MKYRREIGYERSIKAKSLSSMMKNASKVSKQHTEEKFIKMIDEYWRELVEFPYGQICKHLAVCKLFQILENNGYKLDPKLVKHIVEANDEESLKHNTFRFTQKTG